MMNRLLIVFEKYVRREKFVYIKIFVQFQISIIPLSKVKINVNSVLDGNNYNNNRYNISSLTE